MSNILQYEVDLLMGVTEEVHDLHSIFTTLQAVVEDVEGQRVKGKSVPLWLEKLKDWCYEVDDIFDDWWTEACRSQADKGDESRLSFPLRRKIESGIKKAKQRLDDIAKKNDQSSLWVDSRVRQSMDSEIRRHEIRGRETGSPVHESAIVGRDDDVKKVMGLLMGESSEEVRDVPIVVSVVGARGLGKTTLAQLLYDHENVKHHFEWRMWIYVSEDFDVKWITKSILQSAIGSALSWSWDSLNLDSLQYRVRAMVHGKRFLLVLDDVWSGKIEKWEKLKVSLQAGAPGSRVIITTRSETVASAMGSTHVYKLPVLSENDCWLLFSRSALRHQNVEECSELEKIGREIVKKCRGLPLAAKTIGGVMRTKRTKREWELLLENETWSSPDVSQEGILPALLQSYYNLPSPLKQCFAYCSIFPKGHYIEKDDLIKLWMAQGLIRSKGSRAVEEIGAQYIDELLERSLLQDVILYGDGWNVQMHDSIHDLTQFVAGGESLVVEKGKTVVDRRSVRHAAVLSDDVGVGAAILGASCKTEKLRTIILIGQEISGRYKIPAVLPSNLFDQLRSLRALCLSGSDANKLPPSIGKVRHLRYLNLSGTEIVELPETVADLYNLQTLNLDSCTMLCKLPERLRKLVNLRHLKLEKTGALKYMPRGIGRLTALRTLTKFIVGDGQKECAFAELKNLNHLQGKLSIVGLEKVVQMEEAREVEFDKKQYLNELYLKYDGKEKVNGVLESLRPHSSLKLLSIERYRGSTLPRWMEDPSFSNLVSIQLNDCRTCEQLPCLGKLPSLKFLEIWGMKEVRHVGVEFCGVDDDNNSSNNSGGALFPKLEELCFRYMENWEEWELRGGVVIMPSLLTLEIKCCPKLKALPENLPLSLENLRLINDSLFSFHWKFPVFPNLRRLNIDRCDRIKSIPGGWLGKLRDLDELCIQSCQKLKSLPKEIQYLTTLRKLEITDCPRLKKRYKERGEDWHKIAHIPNVIVR